MNSYFIHFISVLPARKTAGICFCSSIIPNIHHSSQLFWYFEVNVAEKENVTPQRHHTILILELLARIELATSSLPRTRSTNWAIVASADRIISTWHWHVKKKKSEFLFFWYGYSWVIYSIIIMPCFSSFTILFDKWLDMYCFICYAFVL